MSENGKTKCETLPYEKQTLITVTVNAVIDNIANVDF